VKLGRFSGRARGGSTLVIDQHSRAGSHQEVPATILARCISVKGRRHTSGEQDPVLGMVWEWSEVLDQKRELLCLPAKRSQSDFVLSIYIESGDPLEARGTLPGRALTLGEDGAESRNALISQRIGRKSPRRTSSWKKLAHSIWERCRVLAGRGRNSRSGNARPRKTFCQKDEMRCRPGSPKELFEKEGPN